MYGVKEVHPLCMSNELAICHSALASEAETMTLCKNMQPVASQAAVSLLIGRFALSNILNDLKSVVQHEISVDAYNRLTSTPDAKGRTIEVIKVPVPYPLFRTYKEASGVHVSASTALTGSCCHQMGCMNSCFGAHLGPIKWGSGGASTARYVVQTLLFITMCMISATGYLDH